MSTVNRHTLVDQIYNMAKNKEIMLSHWSVVYEENPRRVRTLCDVIECMLKGLPVGLLVLNEDSKTFFNRVVVGQMIVDAIVAFMDDRIYIKHPVSGQVKFSEMTIAEQRRFKHMIVMTAVCKDLSDGDETDIHYVATRRWFND